MNTMQNLILEADKMAETNASGNGTAITETSIGYVRVYRERQVKCVNMKKLNVRTLWKLNGKAISADKLSSLLK